MDKVEDFEDISEVDIGKLIKLLDVAKDYRLQCWEEYGKADERVKSLQMEIHKRLEEAGGKNG